MSREMEPASYVTDEVKAFIGYETDWVTACDVVERGEIRRFIQAVMDDDPIYWNDEYAASTRYGGVVAPPLFPLHSIRRPPGAPDPLDRAKEDPNYDGTIRDAFAALPPLPINLPRLLNGGNSLEIYQLARPNQRVRVKSKYLDIYQKEGRTGPLVFVLIETVYATEEGGVLLKAVNTRILR